MKCAAPAVFSRVGQVSRACLLALMLSGQALAHAHLTAAEPAADATVAAPTQLTLHFSEKLDAHFSGLSVTGTSNQAAPMKVAVSADGLSLVATPAAPLAPGVYTVSWHAVTADTHRTQGTYRFTVLK